MASKVKQYYDVKFPFTIDNYDGHFIDLNNTLEGKVASEIAHVILTRKGTRIRKPEFGTDLIKYIFEPNDELTWEGVFGEIKTAVKQYVPNAVINDVAVIKKKDDEHSADDDASIYIDVRYGVVKGKTIENNRMGIKL